MSTSICLFCGVDVEGHRREPPHETVVDCKLCGRYRLSEYAFQKIHELVGYVHPVTLGSLPDAYLYSALLREQYEASGQQEMRIDDPTSILDAARRLEDPSEAVDRLLLHVARRTSRMGDLVMLPDSDRAIAYARDHREFENLLDLGDQMGLLDNQEHGVRPTPEGWRRISELRVQVADPARAFVAMSFQEGMEAAYRDGIAPALDATGFTSIRVDLIQHNLKIDDRIVAEIRKASLLVADFTGHRQNVYFEAGLAVGLGRHVIWTCRGRDVELAHFDTRQYNHIVWNDPSELRDLLQARIEATIPRPNRKRQGLG